MTERIVSQRHPKQGDRRSTAFLNTCFHTDMDQPIHAHTSEPVEPECIVALLLFKTHLKARRDARLRQEICRNKVIMSTGKNAKAMEPNTYYTDGYWDRAMPKLLTGDVVTYLVLKRLVIFYDSEQLNEESGHENPLQTTK